VLLSSNFRLIAGGLTLVVVAATGAPALAQETANLNVSAEVQASCDVFGGSLNFGIYTGDATEGQGSFSYVCTDGTNITLSLGAGQHEQDGGIRAMAGNGGILRYQLYSDSGRAQVWGTAGDALGVTAPSSSEETVQVYGRIEADQDAPAGSYSDTVQITLNVN
jgi:spore coat protein U-like protein